MQSKHKKRICIVTRSLSEGGADRMASIQSMLFDELGYEVYVVTVLNSIIYPFKGTLFNLGEIKEQNDTLTGRFQRLTKFRRFIKDNRIDIIIDHRVRIKPFSEYIISFFVYPKTTIYMVHNSTINRYFPPIKFLTQLAYGNSLQIVCVSKRISSLVRKKYGFKNVSTIYNIIDTDYIAKLMNEPVHIEGKYVFWYGRMENGQKNLVLLLEAFDQSELPKRDIVLVLMGSGKDQERVKRKIQELNSPEKVMLLEFSENPFAFVKNSLFTVLSSKYEGFPMTILESLACGIPVVSVKYENFEDGVIRNGYNGLLVENNDPKALAEGMERLVNDKKLYLSCRTNALNEIMQFKKEPISKKWQQLIED